jgi:hypothetical protein
VDYGRALVLNHQPVNGLSIVVMPDLIQGVPEPYGRKTILSTGE